MRASCGQLIARWLARRHVVGAHMHINTPRGFAEEKFCLRQKAEMSDDEKDIDIESDEVISVFASIAL